MGWRSAGNTRTKVGQIPHLLISIEYKKGEEFQCGRLHDYIQLKADDEKQERYGPRQQTIKLDLNTLIERINGQKGRIEK